MDQWRKKSLREEKEIISGTQSPSFSSTLLDAIYRSFDESEEGTIMKKKLSNTNISSSSSNRNNRKEEEEEQVKAEISRVDKWMMEKKSTEKTVNNVRRKSVPVQVPGWVPDNFDRKVLLNDHRSCSSLLFHSTSSSSDSSSGGGFSSSEAESVYGTRTRTRSSSVPVQRPKPIRTSSVLVQQDRYMTRDNENERNQNQLPQKTKSKKNENGVFRTKSRAKKIYSDLLKAKQPISPGGKLASFINALFTPKKSSSSSSKISTSSVIVRDDEDFMKSSLRYQSKSKSEQNSTCSSAASPLSKSCLSKAPSSNHGNKLSDGMKRSVRFYPVSVIVDEESRPCGQKSLHQDEPNRLEELRFHVKAEKNHNHNHHHHQQQSRGVEEVALDLLKNYHRKNSSKVRDYNDDDHIEDVVVRNHHRKDNEDEDEEDRASYASSDLFELDNLASIGIDHHRYNEELPVYETTHFETNRAIANGFIL